MLNAHVRPAAVAGMFYPADPVTLSHEVATLCGAVSPRLCFEPRAHRLKALIVPHAGYVYSGAIAASAYARLATVRDRIRRVVLLGPCHRVSVRGIAVPSATAFRTPLGDVPVDHMAINALRALPQVVESAPAHAHEHSLEVQLPFLQHALRHFSLVPLAVGQTTAPEVAEVIEALWDGDGTLVVVSSDLSHYLPYDEARAADTATVRQIAALEPLTSYDQACGALPVNGLIAAARRHGMEIELLDQRNSGDTAGDRSRVVGYAAFALYNREASGDRFDARHDAVDTARDNAAMGAALLARARNAIAEHFGLATHAEPWHPALHQHGATFVTLTQAGQLRGCIGTLTAWRSLDDDVRANAVAAAFHDPRFAPLRSSEFDETRVEVSLLSPTTPLPVRDEADALAQLRPGVDGVVLSHGRQRGTFLPQVWAQLPDPAQFLAQLKCKAGLAADFWSPDLRLERYTVSKWQEPTTQ